MSNVTMKTMDGNEAVAYIAYRVNEVCSIYPITPSSPMAEFADQWTSEGKSNIWGHMPIVAEMQSEGGAAGALHGSLQTGALTTTFTASQGLLLMIPNMYKIAGELTPVVFQVAARSLAAQGLSIFGDHSDVAAVRETGFIQLASSSVQVAHDMTLISQATTLRARLPILHFFDGFRTSHEVNKIGVISDESISAMISGELVREHRQRGLCPEHPVMRGTAQNPDVYFQGRETVNSFYNDLPGILQSEMDRFAALEGRQYNLFDYIGHEQAERVAVIVGSGAETVRLTVEHLQANGEKVGVINVRLALPFDQKSFLSKLPKSVTSITVLDRTKSPGSVGEPLYTDVLTTLAQSVSSGELSTMPRITGGRYGLSSKEFTPAMAKAALDELKNETPKNHFTLGIDDDVTFTSLDFDSQWDIETDNVIRAMFFGLGADGTVGANKNSIKIIGESSNRHAQAYFVYDSKKSGSQTESHLRFGAEPIEAPFLIVSANFIGCHQFNFLFRNDVLKHAADGATFLLNSPYDENVVWEKLPQSVQTTIIAKRLKLWVIDANSVALDCGMGRRTNTIMQTCFFALSNVLPKEEAIAAIKHSIKKTYGKKGQSIVNKNFHAVDETLAHLQEVKVPGTANSKLTLIPVVPQHAPEFVQRVTAAMLKGDGDSIPVSMMPIDGTFPTGTTAFEKRNIADFIPIWEESTCIQCGNCSMVCPHSVIRARFYHNKHLSEAPDGFPSAPISARGFPETRYTLQIYAEDCTGCYLCVNACPVEPNEQGLKAINMHAKPDSLEKSKLDIAFFETLPVNDRSSVDFSSVRGAQFLQPLFEFSGACSGCGETPYVRLLSQLFGDRLLVANATGCSSIYGGNLPTTPWTKNHENRGPAWSNSLFEDNAEFGFGFRLSVDKHTEMAHNWLQDFTDDFDQETIDEILNAPQQTESQIREQRIRLQEIKSKLQSRDDEKSKELLSVIDHLVRRSVWLLGGDGWAYDIGSAGVDHVLASGRDINILVMDTEVYSNTGGQMSKATPLGAVAKFANAGKPIAKKDLALQAISYGNVYVARIALGANSQQTLLALREAEAYPGPSLVLAYSHCIAHGINMQEGLDQQARAVESGYWPLIRYNPLLRQAENNPFVLDSPRPKITHKEYALKELRYKMLQTNNPDNSERMMDLAQQVVNQKWATYEAMATQLGTDFHPDAGSSFTSPAE